MRGVRSPTRTSRRITALSSGASSVSRCSSAVGAPDSPTEALPRRISVPSSRNIQIAVCVASAAGLETNACTRSPSNAALR
jgi:hypothetical protein